MNPRIKSVSQQEMGKHQAGHHRFWRGLPFLPVKVWRGASGCQERLQLGLIELRIPEDQIRHAEKVTTDL